MEKFIIELSAQEEKIKDLIEPVLVNEGYELVDIKVTTGHSKPVLSVYVDKNDTALEAQAGIILKDLTNISYLVGDILDMHEGEDNLFAQKYELEVSSPGLERPLTKIKHFTNCLEQKIKVKLKRTNDKGSKKVSGLLKAVNEQNIQIIEDDKQDVITVVDFNNIARSNKIFIFEAKQKPKSRTK